MTELIPLFKVFHLFGMVAWFAGLFYLVRIFVYHREALDTSDPRRTIMSTQYNIMERRAYRIICNPAMMITWTFGILLIARYGMEWFGNSGWLHVKLLLVLVLTAYHIYCKRIIQKLGNDVLVMNSERLRLFNEVPTLILIASIVLAIYKNGLNYMIAGMGLISFAVILVIFTKLYKAKRQKPE